MRYFVCFSYRGTDFHGSQSQPNGITVQQVLEEAFTTILRHPVSSTFAGRTDAGVHAAQMWAHLDVETPLDGADIAYHLNSLLPPSIAIARIVPVRDDAHARFSAVRRTYEYRIGTEKDVFRTGLYTRVAPGLDFAAMNQAASLLLGRHDFACFCRVHTDVKTTFCTVSRAEWVNESTFVIAADRFLRNMVRAVTGTLFMIGRGQMNLDEFRAVIDSHNRCAAGQSAPAEGLYLVEVEYPKELFLCA